MTRLLLTLSAIALLAACGGRERVAFDGNFYRASAKAPRADRANFTASAGPISRGLNGAVQAARHEAIRHCIKFYGTSDILYAVPEGAPLESVPRNGDRVVLSGRCIELE